MRVKEIVDGYGDDYAVFVNDIHKAAVVQHTLEWKRVIERTFGFEPRYLVTMGDGKPVGAFPLFLCRSKLGNVLSSLPGAGAYGGILADDYEVAEALFNAALGLARANDCLTLSAHTAPFAEPVYWRLFDSKVPNFFQYLDLLVPLEPHRNIKRQLRMDLEIRNGTEEDLRKWYVIAEKRMRDVGTRVSPLGYLDAIREAGYPFLVARDRAGVLVGGGLYPHHNLVMDDFFSCGLNTHAMLVDRAIFFARSSGRRFFNFQSSPDRGGVYEYKRRWGAAEADTHFLTKFIFPANQLAEIPISEVKKNFPWTFVAPYSSFKNDVGWKPKE